MHKTCKRIVSVDGLVVACFPLDPKFAGSNPVEYDGFLREIKIRSTTAFGWGVKPSAPSRKIYGMLKNPMRMKEIPRRQNSEAIFFHVFFFFFTITCLSAGNCESGMIIKSNWDSQYIRNSRNARVA
jgi:hypothetical protein